MTHVRVVIVALSLVLVCSWASGASAQQNQQRQNKKYVATRAITIDAQTGELRVPNAQETKELVDSLLTLTNRSTEALQATTMPNGARAVNLEDRFQSGMLVRPNPHGTSEICLATTLEEAAECLGLVEEKDQQ